MALDRRIRIDIEQPGRRAGPDETEIDPDTGNPYRQGEYIDGPTISYPVWAERRSAGSSDQTTSAGIETVNAVTYLVRWFRELEIANVALVSVVDEYDLQWDVDSIAPGDARRRTITLAAVRVG